MSYTVCVCFLYFFFSSRRRHTRCLSDWSSDVCSSDLADCVAVPDGADGWFYGHDCGRRRTPHLAGAAEFLSQPSHRAWHEQAAIHLRFHQRDVSLRTRRGVEFSGGSSCVAAGISRLTGRNFSRPTTRSRILETHRSLAAAGRCDLRLVSSAAWRKRHPSAHFTHQV